MSCHKINFSEGWELGCVPEDRLNRWYRVGNDWECRDGCLVGRKRGPWFQALAYPNCAPAWDYVFSCRICLGENSLARINLNYSVQRLAQYTVQFRTGAAPEAFYVFQELFDHRLTEGKGEPAAAGREFAFCAERVGDRVTVRLDGEEWCVFDADCPCGRYTALAVLEGEASFREIELRDAGTGERLFFEDGSEGLPEYCDVQVEDLRPEEWIPAEIPGSVQSSLLRAGRISDPYFGTNGPSQTWTDDRRWVYRKRFRPDPALRGKDCRIVFEGIDYRYFVFLNGHKLGYHEGMYGSELQIDPWLDFEGENELLVCLLPVAALPAHNVVRPYIFHRWHFNMDVVPAGIWRNVWLDPCDKVSLLDPQVTTLGIEDGRARLACSVTVVNLALWPYEIKGKWSLSSPYEEDGTAELEFTTGFCNGSLRVTKEITIEPARLWYPNGLGKQELYEVSVAVDLFRPGQETAEGHDELCFRTGIRTVRMIPEPGEGLPAFPARAANTRRNASYNWCFSINDEPFFAKGANWMPVDQLYRLSRDRYERLLTLARDAHMNLLRPWGGGLFETEDFYELCDELGLCVWQELPMSCGYYQNSSLSVWEDTIRRNVLRLRNHPSLVMWCGGNEIEPDCPENREIVDMAAGIIGDLDPGREFHRASPYGGDNHSYVVNWQGLADYSKYRFDVSPAATEYSMSSPMCLESLLKVLPPEERNAWPPSFPDDLSAFRCAGWELAPRGESALSLHDAHLTSVTSRMIAPMSDCGLPNDLEEYVRYLQTAHGILLQYADDWFRSRWPDCTVALSWVLNAPEPNTLCWSQIDFFGVPKRAYYYAKRAFEPLHAGATGFDQCTPPGGVFRAKLFVCCENGPRRECRLCVRLLDSAFRPLAQDERIVRVRPGVVHGGFFEYAVPRDAAETTLFLVTDLLEGDRLLSRSFYCPRIGEPAERVRFYPDGPAIRDAERSRTAIRASAVSGGTGRWDITVENLGEVPAFQVALEFPDREDRVSLSDNYFWLDPGERAVIVLTAPERPPRMRCSAWNADAEENALS